MSLWGATTADESKPKNLTQAEKDAVFATAGGWAKQPGGNDNTASTPEILACISNLSVKLGAANLLSMTLVNIADNPFDNALPDVLLFDLVFNERIIVTGLPQFPLDFAGGTPSTGQAEYLSGSGTNTLRFDYTLTAANEADAGEFTFDTASSLLQLNGGTLLDENGTAVTLDIALGGVDGATNIKTVFNTSVAAVVVTA
jgi:hypothetical protein